MGSALEYYDFYIYGLASALIFGPLFFKPLGEDGALIASFATYGVIDRGATAHPFVPPVDVIPEFGALEVTTSATALQTLTDALIDVADERYTSSDALSARIIAIRDSL